MRKHKLLLMLALALLTVLAACGGGGGGGASAPAGPAVTGDLHSVFYRTLTNATVMSITLKRQNGNIIPNATVTFDTRVDSTGNRLAGAPTSRQTGANTTADFALPAGTYPVLITMPVSTAAVGNLNDTVTISGNAAKTYQTSQQNWTLNSTTPFTRLDINIYQTDASGNLNFGTDLRPLNPLVLSTSVTATTAGATTATFTTELFKGSYRAVVRATPKNPLVDLIMPYITPANAVVTAGGDSATDTVPTISLTTAGNFLKLTLFDEATAISNTTTPYNVEVFDKATLLQVGFASTGTGTNAGLVTIPTGAITDVVAVVSRVTNTATGAKAVEAIHPYIASAQSVETLHKYLVVGTVVTPVGGTIDPTTDGVIAQTKPGTGIALFDKTKQGTMFGAVTSLGVIQNFKLFEGTYTLSADINNFPDSDKVALTVAGADTASQNIAVRSGGLITGRIQTQSNNDIPGVVVIAVDSTTNETVAQSTTSATGVYTLSVPFGTYNVFAGGAVTRNIAVSTSTVTKNFTRFTVNGRLLDSLGGGLAGTVITSGITAPASAVGTFQIDMMEGESWVLFIPPANQPSLGPALEAAVQIDASTITTN